MNIKDFNRKPTATSLNETLAKTFGEKINFQKFDTEQLLDVRNKIRTKIFNVETTESYDSVHQQDYQKNKMFLDVINAEIEERKINILGEMKRIRENQQRSQQLSKGKRRRINENPEQVAEIVMASKDMVDRITGWIEDTAGLRAESLLELSDAIRLELGSEKSSEFVNRVKPALEDLYNTLESTRLALNQGVTILTGGEEPSEMLGGQNEEQPPSPDMAGDEEEFTVGGEVGTPPAEFDVGQPAAGGTEEAGRAQRESVQRRSPKKKISKSLIENDLNEIEFLFQYLIFLKNNKKFKIPMKSLSRTMVKMGHSPIDQESFEVYNQDARIQNLVKNYDENVVELNNDKEPDLDNEPQGQEGDTVAQMASRATDLSKP